MVDLTYDQFVQGYNITKSDITLYQDKVRYRTLPLVSIRCKHENVGVKDD
jgi:hypothetical protein